MWGSGTSHHSTPLAPARSPLSEWVITSDLSRRANHPARRAVYLPSGPLLTIATAWFTASSTP